MPGGRRGECFSFPLLHGDAKPRFTYISCARDATIPAIPFFLPSVLFWLDRCRNNMGVVERPHGCHASD